MSQGENPFADDVNPYRASPMDASLTHAEVGGAEAIRREYIAHESSVKSIGTLYFVGCILMSVLFIGMLAGALFPNQPAEERVAAGVGAAFFLAIACFQGFVGYNLRSLKPWARWVAVVLSAFGLLGFPVGTLISAYFLYLLLAEKANTIFSPEYQQVIAQTPHVKYKTPMIAWIVLGLLLLALVAGVSFLLIPMAP